MNLSVPNNAEPGSNAPADGVCEQHPFFCSQLFRWLLWEMSTVTGCAIFVMLAFLLLNPEVMRFRAGGDISVFVFVHSLMIVRTICLVRKPSFGFLLMSGVSRDQHWRHITITALSSGLLVWGLGAAIVFSGLRSKIQDQSDNPAFPFMGVTEQPVMIWCFVEYLILIPVLHYAWIRSSQTTRGADNGFLMTIGVVLLAITIDDAIDFSNAPTWVSSVIAFGFLLVSLGATLATRRAYLRLEIVA